MDGLVNQVWWHLYYSPPANYPTPALVCLNHPCHASSIPNQHGEVYGFRRMSMDLNSSHHVHVQPPTNKLSAAKVRQRCGTYSSLLSALSGIKVVADNKIDKGSGWTARTNTKVASPPLVMTYKTGASSLFKLLQTMPSRKRQTNMKKSTQVVDLDDVDRLGRLNGRSITMHVHPPTASPSNKAPVAKIKQQQRKVVSSHSALASESIPSAPIDLAAFQVHHRVRTRSARTRVATCTFDPNFWNEGRKRAIERELCALLKVLRDDKVERWRKKTLERWNFELKQVEKMRRTLGQFKSGGRSRA